MNPVCAPLYPQAFGTYPENVEIPQISQRNPTPQDLHYPLGKRWINTTANDVFVLSSFSFSGLVKSANWQNLSSASFSIANAGISPNLTSDNTEIMASGTIPSSLVFLASNNLGGEVAPVNVQTVETGNFFIATSSGNASNYFYLVVN